jgi:peptidoglycan/LPS O-acetylase OafA/YrhL
MIGPSRLQAHKINDLQVFRGIAILVVLLEHAPQAEIILSLFPHPIAVPGWLGVDLFFVISGYVITRSLVRDRFEPLSFLIRRLFRLTPALLLLVGLVGGVTMALSQTEFPGLKPSDWVPDPAKFWLALASVLCGFATFRSPWDGGILAVAWSLSVEDQFYAALAVVCVVGALALRRRAPQALPGLLFVLAAGLYLTITWMRLSLLFTGHFKGTSSPPLFYLQAFRFDLLALGVILGFIGPRFHHRQGASFNNWGPFWTPILLGLPFGLAALCGLSLRLRHGLVLPVAGWCFGLLVLIAAHEKALPSGRGWGCRVLTYLGDRSYTIYLFHVPAMMPAVALLGTSLPIRSIGYCALHAAISIAVLFPLVELVYRVVERPLTEVGRRVSRRLRIIPADPSPEVGLSTAQTVGRKAA